MKASTFLAALALVSASCVLAEGAAAPNLKSAIPDLKLQVGTVSPEILALTIQAGQAEYGKQAPYEAKPGDKIEKRGSTAGWVSRDGKLIGRLVGKDGRLLAAFDRVVGAPLDTAWADKPASYRLTSEDDPNYRTAQAPEAVYRKSKPSDLARTGEWQFDAPVVHVLYLKFARPLVTGKKYRLTFAGGRLGDRPFVYEPSIERSDAVHVSQIGFRPDDPVKIAYLSTWMGNGGGLSYAIGTPFHVLDDKTGRPVFDGKVELSQAADNLTEDAYKRNYSLTNVYALDFSGLKQPGVYRVYVEGVGCSYPLEIGPQVWRKAFLVSAKGFYHQRSGIALGPPHTTFIRPRCFHPDDGLKVLASTCSLMDSGNGLNAQGTDSGNFGNLVKGKTDQVMPNAWGGYFDAGDWDRRIQHLGATRLLLELAAQFPDFAAAAGLNIPETGKGLPDLVAEALWNVDFYRRLQTPEGGVRGGIESAEHPQFGEASWQESLTVMTYAPDLWSSYVYAGVAARAAGVLESLKRPPLAKAYRESALRAMRWAEDDLPKHKGQKLPHPVNDARNLAAAELFRLTGEAEWHGLFLATTVFKDPKSDLFVWQQHEQGDAAFVYLQTERPNLDADVKKNCLAALLRAADMNAELGRRSAFGYTRINFWQPFVCVLGAPRAVNMLRAHAITGKEEYLRGAVLACQAGAGANPSNLCYTTGVGANWPQNPLIVDMRGTGQPPPPGITIYGPMDIARDKDSWQVKLVTPFCSPPPIEWPTTEAYFDVCWFPAICEFTVHETLGPNAYTWGYLAARK